MNPFLITIASTFTALFVGFALMAVSITVSDQDLEERLWRMGLTLVWAAIGVSALGVIVAMWWLAVAS